jgi:GT2 family glycosyltransferase
MRGPDRQSAERDPRFPPSSGAGRFDLGLCVGVEALSDHECRLAIAEVCAAARDIIFCASLDDPTPTRGVAIRPRSFWIETFAQWGFGLDGDFDAAFIAREAMRFTASAENLSALDAALRRCDQLRKSWVGAVEQLAQLNAERSRLLAEADVSRQEASRRDRTIETLSSDLERSRWDARLLREREFAREQTAQMLQAELRHLRAYVSLIQSTVGWAFLERVRRGRDALIPTQGRRRRAYLSVRRGLLSLLGRTTSRDSARQGDVVEGDLTPLGATLDDEAALAPDIAYRIWVGRHTLTDDDVASLRRDLARLPHQPRISILTPVYNTPETALRRMAASVSAQIYPNWELCVIDDGSTDPRVGRFLDELQSADARRIRVRHLVANEGIAGASAAALELASGEFVALLDHDDELAPEALYEVVRRLNADPDLDIVYSDEDKLELDGRRVEPFFKPGWSPDLLLSMNYIGHLAALRRSLVEDVGGFRRGFDGSQDYDLFLRCAERTERIAHIPKILYHWRKLPSSASTGHAAKPLAHGAATLAIAEALRRRDREASVESVIPGRYAVRYALRDQPLVSIIIPTRDRWQLLRQCLDSIRTLTDYPNYEIVVLDNDSTEPATRAFLGSLDGTAKVAVSHGQFNFARINNEGVKHAAGDYFLFLNNDTTITRPQWLRAMLEHAQRPEVGAVGARLLYPDGRIQHAGVVLGIGGVAGHAFKYDRPDAGTHFDLPNVVRNCSAVTAACMMVRRQVFEEVGGFDERFAVAFNDVDLCCRIRARGYLIVYTPLAELCHLESASRKSLHPPEDDALMWQHWGDAIQAGDPYYNPNLTRVYEDWRIAL